MLITDSYIYLELHKTGCSHTRKILHLLEGETAERYGQHNSYFNTDKGKLEEIGFRSKKKLGNIRNPWDWYVSLWAFGCMKKGGLYHKLTQQKSYSLKNRIKNPRLFAQNKALWEELYSDPYKVENFRKWLLLLLDNKGTQVTEGFTNYPLASFAGFLTFRFLRLYTYNSDESLRSITSTEDVSTFYGEHSFMDVIIKNEAINETILSLSDVLGANETTIAEVLKETTAKSNSSIRNSYTGYYDTKTKDLVSKRESFIIDRFGYQF
ncbi:sulfotransferase family 2 domain-containing protein [Marinirhabdus gelatinilytica]|uniref:Sulfotransferase family protein n=1 Tax=Marinirhabdus gelatinilytica TaxID=1703343 RepID=A0A370Q8V4_9FLAO|nr:sulfotransferase family 2 domain-containing protein [Marinirhabdus gelatinilytica]RDK84802.1 hypothetical protein C8D94_104175 [Marinirhabdus gelatinilytica]